MDALMPAEASFAIRRLAATKPSVQALALVVDRDELARLCREEFTGVDMHVSGWHIDGRWFGLVVGPPSTPGQRRRTATMEWRAVAMHIARSVERVGLEYRIVAVTCFFSQQRGAVRRRSGTRG
jgi:hypothetical protein